ncbi:MAG: diacylglyceryl transferase, partial [Phycisphaerae bacterium]|nr:diacylglyceryl transferase [Phycisphaerae bacterium]
LGAPSSGVIGMYLVLAGFARFAEEAYRGEPQTRVIGGLRFYQWCGLALVILGAAISCIATAPVPLASWPDSASLALAVAIGVVHWFAMGVDFPRAQRRFARLV